MNTTIILDKQHYKIAAAQATAAGLTVAEFLCVLIDARVNTFDEILAPVRKGFETTTDGDLDKLFKRAKRAARNGE